MSCGQVTPERPEKKQRVCWDGGYVSEADCKLDDLKRSTSLEVETSALRFASTVEKNVVIYDCPALEACLSSPERRRELMAEWAYVLHSGPGVLVFKGACRSTSVIDATSEVFNDIIADQRKNGGWGDHFAKAGANDRIWNSLEKLCMRAPDVFGQYYANPWIAAISEAWLGPGYQVTSQVNVIRPGGQAQKPHRDYHLGFQDMKTVSSFPLHAQVCLSPMLTLQGAVAHVDVPLESGPTKLLPFSHQYAHGYLAWKRPEFEQFFEDNYVQLPLQKGDMLYFNPALLHAGGENRTSGATAVHRMVNLLQVSSPFGRAMESVNRLRMCKALFPALLRLRGSEEGKANRFGEQAENNAIAACAEGYQFPTNLDLDIPEGSNAPVSQADLFRRGLAEGLSPKAFSKRLDEQASRWQATV